MTAAYITRNRTWAIKQQVDDDTEAPPDWATDAFRVTEPEPGIEYVNEQTNYSSGSQSDGPDVPGGASASHAGGIWLKGQGVAGQAPEFNELMKIANFAETLLAADDTGAAVAGTINTITLAGGHQAQVGHIIEMTSGAASGDERAIYQLVGDVATVTPDFTAIVAATDTYNIKASALYSPASLNLLPGTSYMLQNSRQAGTNARLWKAMTAVANLEFTIAPRAPGRMQATVTGKLVGAPSEISPPSTVNFDPTNPVAFRGGESHLGGNRFKFNEITIDLGQNLVLGDDGGDLYGYDGAVSTIRRPTGTMNPDMTELASYDAFTDWDTLVEKPMWLSWGTISGNRVSVLMPALQNMGPNPTDVDGRAAEEIPVKLNGIDDEIHICIF